MRHHTPILLTHYDQPGRSAASPETRAAIGDVLPACALLAVTLVILAFAYLSGAGENKQYFVMAPPAWSLGETVSRMAGADGRLVTIGRLPNVVVAASDRTDFGPAMRTAGAWLVVPIPAQWGCGANANEGIPG